MPIFQSNAEFPKSSACEDSSFVKIFPVHQKLKTDSDNACYACFQEVFAPLNDYQPLFKNLTENGFETQKI